MRHLLLILLLTLPVAAAAQPDPFYEIDALNEGLGAPPEGLDRSSPQDSMEAFLDAAADEDWDRAAHLLDLARIETERQGVVGPLAAQKLATILDRKVQLSWAQLLDRVDALDANATSNSAVAGQERRSLLLDVIEGPDRPLEVRLERVKPGQGDPVWVFSRRSVENIDPLYGLYGPSQFEMMLPEWMRQKTSIGLFWWEILAFPLMIVGAALAGATTYRVTRRAAERAEGTIAEVILDSLRWPLTIAVLTTVVWAATSKLFIFSGPVDSFLSPAIVLGYAVALILFVMNALDGVLDQVLTFEPEELSEPGMAQTRSRATFVSALRRALLVVLTVSAIAIALASAGVFRTFGFSLLASAGAVTLILGFAARKVLGNIMASLQIALNRSARIGDQIIYDGDWCTVERIHFTYVQLKMWTGNRKVVPVEQFVTDAIDNMTLQDVEMYAVVKLKLAHSADVDALEERFAAICAEEEEIVDQDDIHCLVTGHDALGQDVRFHFPVPDPSTGWLIECRVRRKLIAAAWQMQRERDVPMMPEGAAGDVAA